VVGYEREAGKKKIRCEITPGRKYRGTDCSLRKVSGAGGVHPLPGL